MILGVALCRAYGLSVGFASPRPASPSPSASREERVLVLRPLDEPSPVPIVSDMVGLARARASVSDPAFRRHPVGRADVLLVCSSGGHLLQLLALSDAWKGYRVAWVTNDRSDARSLLAGERVVYGYGPTTRSLRKLLRNFVLAVRVLRETQPQVIVTTGAAIAVPFAWLARGRGAKVVYIESFARTESPSLTCAIIRRVADRVYVQWPELVRLVPGSAYAGSVFSN
jgi:beta-1,4-N-acetylglucosaminyltransferase